MKKTLTLPNQLLLQTLNMPQRELINSKTEYKMIFFNIFQYQKLRISQPVNCQLR